MNNNRAAGAFAIENHPLPAIQNNLILLKSQKILRQKIVWILRQQKLSQIFFIVHLYITFKWKIEHLSQCMLNFIQYDELIQISSQFVMKMDITEKTSMPVINNYELLQWIICQTKFQIHNSFFWRSDQQKWIWLKSN